LIKVERPPNFEQILAAFPDADKPGVIFAYGADIYNPSGGNIPKALIAHEAVHGYRQLKHRDPTGHPHPDKENIEAWWAHYIANAEFRYTEELHAHVAEYKVQSSLINDRNFRSKVLQSTALRLIAPLYNYVPPRSLAQAMRDLREEMDR
jgi:hypothetical protein